jgi:putative endonuclease
MYYVYILESLMDGDFYKGFTTDYLKRLEQHNAGESKFTKIKIPWVLIYVESFGTKQEALIREKKLKRSNKAYLKWLIDQPSNLLNNKLDR